MTKKLSDCVEEPLQAPRLIDHVSGNLAEGELVKKQDIVDLEVYLADLAERMGQDGPYFTVQFRYDADGVDYLVNLGGTAIYPKLVEIRDKLASGKVCPPLLFKIVVCKSKSTGKDYYDIV